MLRDPATPSAAKTIAGSALAQVEHHRHHAEALCRDLSVAEVRQLVGLLAKCTDDSICDLQCALEQQVAIKGALEIARKYAPPTTMAEYLLRRGR